jgi:P4 family phage/plasmid primase-like protien
MMSTDLLGDARNYTNNGYLAIPFHIYRLNGELKKRPSDSRHWGDDRGTIRDENYLQKWFGENRDNVNALAVAMHSKSLNFGIDLDKKMARDIFFRWFLPTLSLPLRNKILLTTHTTTSFGKSDHFLLGIDEKYFPFTNEDCSSKFANSEKICATTLWSLKANHTEIKIIGTESCLVERGEGYNCIMGIEQKQTLTRAELVEFFVNAEKLQNELQCINDCSNIIAGFWATPNRNDIVVYTSGWLRLQSDVPLELCKRIFEYVINLRNLPDDDLYKTMQKVERSYTLPEKEVAGYSKLIDVIKDQSYFDGLQNILENHGYLFPYSTRSKDHGQQEQEQEQKRSNLEVQILQFVDEELIEQLHLITMSDNDEIWYYDEETGIYRRNAESIIVHMLETRFHGNMNNKRTSEALGVIRRVTQSPRTIFNPSINWIATENCMINIATGQTRAFSPEFLCTTKIPVLYRNPSKSGNCLYNFPSLRVPKRETKIRHFLHEIMNDEDVELFLRYLAYCLVREYRYNHWLILNGTGQNGKSILIQLVERFLGEANVSGETLDRLLHERFAIAQLYEKLVNVDADVSAKVVLDNTGIIKKLTGNDLHTGELKYKKPWPFRNYAKLIFSCNKIPETEDLTDAFFRRLIIINFTQQFWGERDDPHIIEKICTKEEFSILFNELLTRLPDVIANGVRKVTENVLDDNYTKFMRSADSVRIFVKEAIERVIVNPSPKDNIVRHELYDYYLEYCKDNGITPESDTVTKEKLQKDHGFQLRKTKVNQIQGYYWIGIRKKDWKEYRKDLEKSSIKNLVEQQYLSPETLDEFR